MTRRPPSFAPRSQQVARSDDDSATDGAQVAATSQRTDKQPRVVSPLSERLAERQRARRRLRIRALVAAAVAVVVLAGAGYVLLASPLVALRASDVQVSGTNEIASTEEVLAVVQPYEDQPLLRLDTAGMREQLLQIVGVSDVTVERSFPHGLVVTVVPRLPVAAVQQDGGFVLLDAEGVQLAVADSQPEGLPLVEVPIGDAATAEALTAVLTVMAALPASLLEQVRTVSAATANEVEFVLHSGAEVAWGSAEESDLKAAVLESLLQVPASRYDVSAPLSPITT